MSESVSSRTMTRRELDRALARHPVVGSEPRRDIYGRLGVHPDRFKFRSLPMEAKVWAKSLVRHDTPKPFMIYGRPRSGTTLLVRLLDQVPAVRCDGELLHNFLFSPVGFLRRLPKRAGPGVQAYGMKLISYHLMEVQRIRRPLAFFDHMGRHGYSVIHLTRNTWDQTLSLMKAQESGLYFSSKTTGEQTLRLDPGRFLDLLRWNKNMLDYEKAVMANVEHLGICYDRDLKEASSHQQTIDRLCAHLGVPSAPVSVVSRRTGGEGGLQRVDNIEELADRVRGSDLAHLVPDTAGAP
ncbi:sulfotransferase [Roseibacterium sp. SDUM158017]|uniref:sulfotransferase n=1 Tax=Roseicyclus salinarum TaxID=3036773 RepID=UPI0024150B4C|nr:sulfotransferase [Roseibacterium sp. SDUM158017]MDG4649618.1 sulfotransferase [Roseibacterium sp. SDUM158017]